MKENINTPFGRAIFSLILWVGIPYDKAEDILSAADSSLTEKAWIKEYLETQGQSRKN